MFKNVLRKFTIFITVFTFNTFLAFATNDVQITESTSFNILTSDSTAGVVVTVAAGGQATYFDVQLNYIDITVDNLSTITFSVDSTYYLSILKQSGSNDYALNPTCPTTTGTLTGTGVQSVLRLQVVKTDPCHPGSSPTILPGGTSNGSGGGVIEEEMEACSRTSMTSIPFMDIINHWGENYIDTLYRRCVVDGKSTNLFAPNDYATRAELVKIVLNTYNLGTASFGNSFLDVFENDWFAPYVISAARRGILIGYVNPDGTADFKPNQYITRAEALKIMLATKGITDFSGYTTTFADVKKEDWFYDYVAYAQSKGVISGNTATVPTFSPNIPITRAEISKVDVLVEEL